MHGGGVGPGGSPGSVGSASSASEASTVRRGGDLAKTGYRVDKRQQNNLSEELRNTLHEQLTGIPNKGVLKEMELYKGIFPTNDQELIEKTLDLLRERAALSKERAEINEIRREKDIVKADRSFKEAESFIKENISQIITNNVKDRIELFNKFKTQFKESKQSFFKDDEDPKIDYNDFSKLMNEQINSLADSFITENNVNRSNQRKKYTDYIEAAKQKYPTVTIAKFKQLVKNREDT